MPTLRPLFIELQGIYVFVDDINIAIRSRTRGTSPRLIGLGLSMEEKIRG